MTLQIRRVIDGKLYNTETAEFVCDMSGPYNRGDFNWDQTYLYRSPKGQFFVAGEGHASSRWGRPVGDGRYPGNGLFLVTDEGARTIAEKHCGNDVGTFTRFFGEPEEG